MKRNIICTSCPMGCEVEIEIEDGKVITTKGNTCKRGAVYAEAEFFHPERVLTTSVKTNTDKRLSVRSVSPLPKEKIFECIDVLSKIVVDAPIEVGDVICKNILETGVDIIATRQIKE